jgi:hypothetical protein
MPYRPTGRRPGRPPKQVDGEPRRTLTLDLAASGMEYLERRAALLQCQPQDVAKTALKEYAERYPIKEAKR